MHLQNLQNGWLSFKSFGRKIQVTIDLRKQIIKSMKSGRKAIKRNSQKLKITKLLTWKSLNCNIPFSHANACSPMCVCFWKCSLNCWLFSEARSICWNEIDAIFNVLDNFHKIQMDLVLSMIFCDWFCVVIFTLPQYYGVLYFHFSFSRDNVFACVCLIREQNFNRTDASFLLQFSEMAPIALVKLVALCERSR